MRSFGSLRTHARNHALKRRRYQSSTTTSIIAAAQHHSPRLYTTTTTSFQRDDKSSASSFPIAPLTDLIAQEVQLKTQALTDTVLTPMNKTYLGPLPRDANQEHSVARPPMPMVFLLGNHSSGKSTFVNYLHGRKIQTTGVAPTDDAFTIIAPGSKDSDQDGPALVGNPSSGFSGLRAFGPGLINHVNLKVRKDLSMQDIMLVDSPGMIDSPAGTSNPWDFDDTSNRDRGYDFQQVTRWFAERADVICLFFDPDKPGTTGETLATLTQSLAGLDHKLLIILNKVDQFERIHDFARSYGSLCWNLSKVIPRKDLPRIYTMCIPQNKNDHVGGGGGGSGSGNSLVDILDDLELQRDEVIGEIKKAPHRRVDNLITTLYDSTRMLRTHVVVAEAARAAHNSVLWKTRIQHSSIFILGQTISAGLISTGALFEFGVGCSFLTVVATAVSVWQGQATTEASRKHVTSREGLNNLFRETHVLNIAEGDEYLQALWDQRVRSHVELALKTLVPDNIPPLSSTDLQSLDDIVNKECANLRKISNPL